MNGIRQPLLELEEEINSRTKLRDRLNANLFSGEVFADEQVRQHKARCWVYATAYPEDWVGRILEKSDAVLKNSLISADAQTVFEAWSEYLDENGDYFEFTPHCLPEVKSEELVWEYIIRLEALAVNGSFSFKDSRRALHCFLHYLREKFTVEESAFIEQIFPVKRDVREGRIVRLVEEKDHPISEVAAGAIMMELARKCVHGRANACRNCAEALALCWMCLVLSRLRLPVNLVDLHFSPGIAIQNNKGSWSVVLPTIFGLKSLPLPDHLGRFLEAVRQLSVDSGAKTILSSKLPELRRTLKRAVQLVDPEGQLGKVTFRSFLTPPHYAGWNHR